MWEDASATRRTTRADRVVVSSRLVVLSSHRSTFAYRGAASDELTFEVGEGSYRLLLPLSLPSLLIISPAHPRSSSSSSQSSSSPLKSPPTGGQVDSNPPVTRVSSLQPTPNPSPQSQPNLLLFPPPPVLHPTAPLPPLPTSSHPPNPHLVVSPLLQQHPLVRTRSLPTRRRSRIRIRMGTRARARRREKWTRRARRLG